MSESILIKNARFVVCDENRVIENGAVYIDGNKIAEVGRSDRVAKKHKSDIVIDASKKAVIPGLIDSHSHVGQAYVRGLIEDLPVKGIMETLKKSIYFGYEFHNEESAYVVEMAGRLEAIKNGTTTNLDCMIFPESMARAARDSGLRSILCPQVMTDPGMPDADSPEEYLRMTEDTIRKWHLSENGRIHVRVHPHNLFTCTPDYLVKCVEIAKKHGVGIGTHMAEGLDTEELIKRKYGRSTIELAYDLGLLGPKTIGFHCIQLSNKDIQLLKLTDTKVAHCPVANAKWAFGVARVPRMLKKGITVGLGTDGAQVVPLDMFGVMNFTALVHKVDEMDASAMPAVDVFKMATKGGAKALGLEKEVGSLETGKKADVVILDLTDPVMFPVTKENIIRHLVYYASGSRVKTVIVDGRILMKDRKVEVFDEDKAVEKVRRVSDKFVDEFTKKLN
jgi:5-methylthioadenosine/S-adenosylhomocysteine deaminase